MPVPITFHIFHGDQVVRSETLEQDVIKIGKLESSHLRIDDEGVSRMHSVVEVSGPGEVYIIDLGSASGTIVNGQKVNKTKLESGDQLQFGGTRVAVEIGAEASRAVAAPTGAPGADVTQQGIPLSQPPGSPHPEQGVPAGYPQQPAGGGYAPPQTAAGYAPPQQPAGGGYAPQQQQPAGYAPQQPAGGGYAPQQPAQQAYAPAAGAGMAALSNENITYQMIPTAPPVNPADVDSSESAVEVIVMWGSSILHVEHLSPPRGFTVGEATDSKGKLATDFLMGSESIGVDSLPITVESGASVAVVIPNGASGDVTVNDQSVTFADLAAQGQLQASSAAAGGYQYPLPPGATARVDYRGFTFVVKPVSAARPVGIGGAKLDKGLGWIGASMLLHIGMLLLFYFLPPSSSSLSLDLLNADDRFAKYLIEPPEMIEEETPEWLEDSKMDDEEGGKGKRHKDEEGQMGKKDEKKTKNKFGIEGPEDNQDPQMAREEAKEMAANAGIIGILKASVGAFNSPTSPYGAETALGNDPMSALGALMGDQIGGNFGFGGLGLRGTGRGGGGTGEGTIGLGNIGTIGHGAGGGTGSGYGRGAGGFRGRRAKVPRIRTGKADVRGSLSKEVIRRVIRRHINEVRFCYEQELNSRPDLQGRVAVKFIISPTGAVQTAAVSKSTLGNAKAEQCIAKAVRRWTFPAPEGGGIVVVNYPFVLAQTGG
ncbi:MAG: TonB family protein [Myxococcales bacterium]|nr:TonB family protein [Myxococcales bacterium]